MALNWIDVNDFSIHSLLLLERFQIRLLLAQADRPNARQALATVLAAHPAERWTLAHRCPERAALVDALAAEGPAHPNAADLRQAEVAVMASVEDFITYTEPERMDERCDFIYGWQPQRLHELVDLKDKLVLDVGSGSGRLAFAAAPLARLVVAVEPVGTLREYLRDKIAREGIANMRVSDGMADHLPYPDATYDVVMSGHVVGDDYDGEIAELTRVTRPGGWLIDCPGEDSRKHGPNEGLRSRGWEEFHYTSIFGGDVWRYRTPAGPAAIAAR